MKIENYDYCFLLRFRVKHEMRGREFTSSIAFQARDEGDLVHFLHRILYVCDDVVSILYAYGEAYKVWRHAGFAQLFV